MKRIERVLAVATKEWRLNLRFPIEYLAHNIIAPVKTTILMLVLYGGFLRGSGASVGGLTHSNYQIYVLLGTTCHSLFMTSVTLFQSRMVTEKWWQTATATFISPASIFEVLFGFILGTVAIHLAIAGALLTFITAYFHTPWAYLAPGFFILCLIALLGFGFGLVGAMIGLSFEGKSFVFDYSLQLLVFFSCFYYPVQIFPHVVQSVVHWLPTYQITQVLQQLYLSGIVPDLALKLTLFALGSVASLVIPAVAFDYCIRKYGIVGY